MLPTPRENLPTMALGVASVVLSTIGLLLFFLPVLGIPIASCAFALALAGLVRACWSHQESLRWGVAGIGCSLTALSVGLVINFAPVGESPRPQVPRLWQEPSGAPYVSPPAQPGFMEKQSITQ